MSDSLDYSKLSDEELKAITDGDYSKLSDATLKHIANAPAVDKKETPKNENELPGARMVGAAIGFDVGKSYATPAAGAYYVAEKLLDRHADKMAAARPSVSVEAAPSQYNTPHGVGTGAVKNAEHNVGQVLKNTSAQAALKTPGYVSPGNSTILMPENVAAQIAKEAPVAAQAVAPAAQELSTLGKVKEAVGKVGNVMNPGGVTGKILNTAAPMFSLAGAGALGADALTRATHGDYGRAVVSGLGAIGSGVATFPHPVARAVGTGAALLAPAINYGIDTMMGREGYADGGEVGPYVGYPQINNKPRDPNFVQQSGPFLGGLDAMIGMKRGDVSMLTPQGQAYHEAYAKMEPVGIAANVLPFIGGPTKALGKSAARTLGPKAADMAEGYLSRIGGLQYAVPPGGQSAARTLVEPTAEEIAKFVPKATKQGKLSDFLQNHMDEYFGLHQSDRLGTHGDYMGGTGFPNFQNVNPLHAKNDVVWMNMTPEASNKIIANNKINGKDVVWSNYIGKTDQHKSNRGVFNEILADVYKNNPNMTADQAALVNARMKTITGKDLDIRDKFLMQEEGGGTFDARGNLSRMFGEGFGRGKGKTVLSPNYQSILGATEEEFTKGAPTSAIGTRLHKVYNEPSQFSTKFHPDYDYTVHGKDLGVQFPAVPHTVLDWTQQYVKEGRGGKGSTLPHGNAWFNYMSNPQHINPTFVKRLQSEGFAAGGNVQHMQVGGRPLSAGLQTLQNLIKAEGRTPVVPVPNRWFSQPEKFPHVQGMVNKTLEANQLPREAFHSGAFIDPRTGQILDKNIYNDVGVLIDPNTGRPMMSAGKQSGIDILDPKTGSYTKSNLVRQSLFKPTGGDPMLGEMPFIATIEKGDMGHKYALGTEYATPTEMYNTMSGANPTLRPRSRGDVFGMGDVVGQVQVGGRGQPHDVYEKLFVAPKGSDVPGVKLNKAEGGEVSAEPNQQDIVSQLFKSARELGNL